MKKIMILHLLLLITTHTLAQVFTPETTGTTRSVQPAKTQEIPGFGTYKEDNIPKGSMKDLKITTYTSEPCSMSGNETPFDSGNGDTRQDDRYKCTVSASDGFITFISSIYKYVFFISLVIGVLVMIIIGIMISITGILPEGEEFRDEAKKKIMDIFIGLVALAMIPWLLKTIAPFFFV